MMAVFLKFNNYYNELRYLTKYVIVIFKYGGIYEKKKYYFLIR